uniref:solute carrier family 25 member 53 n=1 Tax=Podarcis muralis TaxID=64176 RepID=UPI0010A07C95|nr:solute carrier family 25 member 53 [Podarcis muralis]
MEENHHKRWSSASCAVGAASSFATTLVTFPVYKTIFRQQLHALSITEAIGQLRQEGLAGFARGIAPPLLARTLQGALMYGTHDNLLRAFSDRSPGPYSLRDRAFAGLLSGFLEALAFGPFERVQNVLQDGRTVRRFPTTWSILEEFNSYAPKERLALGYYRGLSLILTRNGLGCALYFSFKDPLRDGLSDRALPRWLPALVSGSVNGTAISFLLFPLGVLIANVQSQVGKEETLKLPAAAAAVWRARGRKATLLYRGGSLLILRAGVTWGLTTAIYDLLVDIRG